MVGFPLADEYAPGEVPVTLTLKLQLELGAIDAPLKVTTPAPEVACTEPLVQVVLVPVVEAITRPEGKFAGTERPVRVEAGSLFVTVTVSCDVPPEAIGLEP